MAEWLFGFVFGNKLIEHVNKYKEQLENSRKEIEKLRKEIDKACTAENQSLLQEATALYNKSVAVYNQRIVEKWLGFFAKRNKFNKIDFYEAPALEQADKQKDQARRKKLLRRGLLMLIPAALLSPGLFSAIAEQNLYLFFGGLLVVTIASLPGIANIIYALRYASRKT